MQKHRTIALIVVLSFLVGFWARGDSAQAYRQGSPATTGVGIPTSIITSLAAVEREREAAIYAIFGGPLPSTVPSAEREIPAPLGAAAALELIPGRSFFITPQTANGRLAIWHVGHGQDVFREGLEPISAMLEAGFHVIGMDMPPEPHADVTELRPFLEPVALSLNYAESKGFATALMAGLSGGGWTTTVYAALDPRITTSIPIAGSLPSGLPIGSRDSEQDLPGLAIDYLDLYLMASADGRQQIQVLNSDDPCCFKGVYARTYSRHARELARELDGTFDVLVVDSATHGVPMAALQLALR